MQTGEICVANRGAGLLGIALIAAAFYILAGPLLLATLRGETGVTRLFGLCLLALPALLVLNQVRGKLQSSTVRRLLQQSG